MRGNEGNEQRREPMRRAYMLSAGFAAALFALLASPATGFA